VLSNIFVGPAALYFGPDRVVLRWIADKTTQKQRNIAYKPPPFDIAEYYSQFILTFCLGLYFTPFVPLCIPFTAVALIAQYWSLKHMLVKVCAIPPQMSMGFQQYVRHVLRGIMLFWIFVIDGVFERACGGTGECTGDRHGPDQDKPECVCGDGVGLMILIFFFSWIAWTFLPCKSFFCRCFPSCVMACMKCCSRSSATVAPAPGETPRPPREDFAYPMTKQDIQAREEYDGPGSWTYELPTPALYGGIDTSVPIPPEVLEEVHGGDEGGGQTVVVVQNNPAADASPASPPPAPPAPPADAVTPDPA